MILEIICGKPQFCSQEAEQELKNSETYLKTKKYSELVTAHSSAESMLTLKTQHTKFCLTQLVI